MKKLLSFILAFVLIAMPMCVEAYASEGELSYDNSVMPRYTYIDSVSAGISEAALGFVNCLSDCVSFQADKTFVLTCILQRCTASSSWENYKTATETFSGMGSFTIAKTWFAPATYDAYRVKTTVIVKNSSGLIVETTTKASGVIYK
ncbi:MAG: hypothetical protein IKM66_04070 [Clostridia bacterium]|nr:hypothetical protein [Clostridia bacterium]